MNYGNGLLKTIKEYSSAGQLLGEAGKYGVPLDLEYIVVDTLEGNTKKECNILTRKRFRNDDEFIDRWDEDKEKYKFKSDYASLIFNYANGNVCAVFPLYKGKLHGEHYHYLPDGVLSKYIRYKDGEAYGEYATYLEDKNECYVGDSSSGAFGGHWQGTCERVVK